MTEAQVRQKYVDTLRKWVGHKENDGSFRHIIDTYNSVKPLPAGYRMTYQDAWCAATVTAAAIESGLTDIIPRECSCNRMIALFQKMGRWQENDAYKPQPGDIIFYDWDDSGKGDNTGMADHVGVVEAVSGNQMTIIEGNYSDSVKRRTKTINDRYIRGYGLPDYAKMAKALTPAQQSASAAPMGILTEGNEVRFTGSRQYLNSYDDAPGAVATPCAARITLIREGRAHPYHLEGSGVNGWVNIADVLDTNRKSVTDIAQEVMLGKWGNGPERTERLKAAGYDPSAVQREVNSLFTTA